MLLFCCNRSVFDLPNVGILYNKLFRCFLFADRAKAARFWRPSRPAEQERPSPDHVHYHQPAQLDTAYQLYDAQVLGRHCNRQI